MNYLGGLVSVRLTVDNLKHQVMAVLPQFADDMKASIEREVEAAVRGFDFAKEVKETTERELREQIKYAVGRAVSEVFSDPEIKQRVLNHVKERLG